jgi:DNA-binding phage protein
MAAYLKTILEENDPALLAAALGDINQAKNDRFK